MTYEKVKEQDLMEHWCDRKNSITYSRAVLASWHFGGYEAHESQLFCCNKGLGGLGLNSWSAVWPGRLWLRLPSHSRDDWTHCGAGPAVLMAQWALVSERGAALPWEMKQWAGTPPQELFHSQLGYLCCRACIHCWREKEAATKRVPFRDLIFHPHPGFNVADWNIKGFLYKSSLLGLDCVCVCVSQCQACQGQEQVIHAWVRRLWFTQ